MPLRTIGPQVYNISPEILPLFFGPGVVTLVQRNAEDVPISDKLQEVRRARVEQVGPSHLTLRVPDALAHVGASARANRPPTS